VIASHVAQFDSPSPPQPPPAQSHHPAYPPHPMQHMHPHYPQAYPQQPPGPPGPPVNGKPHIKSEPVENRYPLNGAAQGYSITPLPGPQLNGTRTGGQQGVFSFPSGMPVQAPLKAPKIPQVDGPSSSSSSSSSPPPSQSYAPRPSHPSLDQPSQSSTSTSTLGDDEAINSDLDDSSTEDEEDADEGGIGETDIVFCTYDKVRVACCLTNRV
jgi:transcription initiation factor TFIIA large subunit